MDKKSKSEKLNSAVEKMLIEYLEKLDGTEPANLYDLLLDKVERPLIKTVLEHSNNNQSKTAVYLGISRSTLRKKITKLEL